MENNFHPRMLIDAAVKQVPDYHWLPDALNACGCGKCESVSYLRYVSDDKANQAGAEWQFDSNVVLYDSTLGLGV
jgi:hypothetical protein